MGVKMSKISVVMPVYNGELFLRSAIEGILSQTYEDFEFIIINDKSTDSSLNIINEYREVDSRIKVINNEINLGVSRSLNIGIAAANGEYIARMDADDISKKDRFKMQVQCLEQNCDIGLVGCWFDVINEKGDFIVKVPHLCNHEDMYRFSLTSACLCHGSIMGRLSIFKEFNGYNPEYEMAEDYDLWLRVMEKYKIANIPEYLYTYRIHENSVTNKNEDCMVKRANEARYAAIKRRGINYEELEHFSDLWFERSFYLSFGQKLKDKKVVIFGASTGGEKAAKVLRKLGCNIVAILAEDEQYLGNDVVGITSLGKAQINSLSYDFIIIGSRKWKDIEPYLQNQQVNQEKIILSFIS